VPSMLTGSVIAGIAEVGLIVCAPVPIAKSIVSRPGLALALVIASRKEPAPESPVLVTG
jgi:hypothetical protein